MEGLIFTPLGSEMLNEIVVLFWVAAIGTLISLFIEWKLNVQDSGKCVPEGRDNLAENRKGILQTRQD